MFVQPELQVKNIRQYFKIQFIKKKNIFPECFENMDALFSVNLTRHDEQYYHSNINELKTFPHIVSIRSRYGTKCVGVILTKRFILSSAVCLRSPR